ncbi:C-reactive protein [Microcaecilia unicolor]|uniref:Pentraxin family member n=1 Tax=Microcaecilia unicolor TaxID=1415580 RepID=A0A6P7X1U7_9AMPH|nr:C-reactive protein-like [Microcaecilia unicolor]
MPEKMMKTLLCCLFLMITSRTMALQDLGKNVALFPKESTTSYVILKSQVTTSLTSLTACVNFHTTLTRPFALLSIANPGKFNDLLIYKNSTTSSKVFVGDEEIIFTTPESTMGWNHICAAWASSTGVVTLWQNGIPSPRKTMKKGYSIGTQPIIILGQDQDSYGGSFEINQSFEGEIANVQMWNFILSPYEMELAMANSNLIDGNVLEWRSLDYTLQGDVIIQPKLQYKTNCRCNGC